MIAVQASDKVAVTSQRHLLPPVGRRWIDWLLGSDPGLNRLRSAGLSTVSIGLVLAAETLFVRLSGALQIPMGSTLPATLSSKVAAVNHEHLVVFMLLGSIVAMTSSFVGDPKAKGQLVTLLLLPIPLVGSLTLGLALGANRLLCLSLLVVLTTAGTYLRRFGPRGLLAGMLLFFGFFFGFFLHAAVTVQDLGWLTAAIGVGLIVAMAVRFLLFFPNQSRALRRTQRSFVARGRMVISSALDLFDNPTHDQRLVHRLETRLLRLNEAALMIDAQLGDSVAVEDGSSRQQLHQQLFDLEQALSNVARFTVAIKRIDLSVAQSDEVHLALSFIVQREYEAAKQRATRLGELLQHEDQSTVDTTASVLLHRFAVSIVALVDTATDWLSVGVAVTGSEGFVPAVSLFSGWLPGSTGVSSVASNESGDQRGDRLRLQPWTRAAIQMGIALGVATALGDLVSPGRYYWAVIAVFVTFMGANNSGEQTRKAIFRVAGTVIGIVIGSLLVDAVGHHADWSIAVVLVSFFLGMYLMRVNNTFFVIAITVIVSQLYQELHEFSNALLLWRLAETSLGAVVAMVVVTFVFPLRTQRVLRVAFRTHVRAIATLVDHANEVLATKEPAPNQDGLRNDVRAIDASFQTLVSTAQPLRRDPFGRVDEEMDRAVRLASVSRNYSRNLVADLESAPPISPGLRDDVAHASDTFHRSMNAVADAFTGPRDGVYVRSSSLYDRADRSFEGDGSRLDKGCPPIRDLQLIDGSMASIASLIGLKVTDFDTTTVV
jgi:uncharacterized membrane protein YccC